MIARKSPQNRPPREGTVFIFSLNDNESVVGLLVRCPQPASIGLAYYFKPLMPPTVEIDKAILIVNRESFLTAGLLDPRGIKLGYLKRLGELDSFMRGDWVVPLMQHADESTIRGCTEEGQKEFGRARKYADWSFLRFVDIRMPKEITSRLPKDGLSNPDGGLRHRILDALLPPGHLCLDANQFK